MLYGDLRFPSNGLLCTFNKDNRSDLALTQFRLGPVISLLHVLTGYSEGLRRDRRTPGFLKMEQETPFW